ncbi:glucose-induced degradation complex subunit GID8 KNAG_0E02140 [Huiozyma naganishii CBS 8797]|uniref:CTLH domain-containing protein n=1 Tax=Huiozyma naganishii (strain ATCC MYA-139 / BCRC 22969 / CBS 8797 / KCTC 17520 / NBRC 10181 / NCYC 3082 / Yp74L-3) TaxID=1071383 RepID=J7R6L6_HUIN7|nr:hypothetical protein KNAG_0E02140 [Kazachstania naganishii CBS 8797]CCK70475.1 hypothetical protein KNAG_0E02140 [Kazachstania naganishii CBS 8797]
MVEICVMHTETRATEQMYSDVVQLHEGVNPDSENGKVFESKKWAERVLRDKLRGGGIADGYSGGGDGDGTGARSLLSGSGGVGQREKGVPLLLLNYFIVNSFERAAVRMAKELKICNSNADIAEFTCLFMIRERAVIRRKIKEGKILEAMQLIDSHFGVDILETQGGGGEGTVERGDGNDGDLQFKLLLLNLIEMIRERQTLDSQIQDSQADAEFIQTLITYSREKLALRASLNKSYMNELELTMTLLMFPRNTPVESLPEPLRNLFSISLRSKIANLINTKLLEVIELQVSNQSQFPNLIKINESLSTRVPHAFSQNVLLPGPTDETKKDTTEDAARSGGADTATTTTADPQYWRETKKLLFPQATNTEVDTKHFNSNARLIQVMKLWVWCENQLALNNIHVPTITE